MKLLVICGPTATGKTALAVECAKRLDAEIISADALLVYRGLNIGTAKPTEQEKCGIVHHMIDVVDPTDRFSVYDYERLALPIVEDILSRGKTPILCGGTGFYLNAVLYKSGFGGVAGDLNLRISLEEYAREKGEAALFERLMQVDPESAQMLHPRDVKRVIRALEIFYLTGKKKSDQKDERIPRYPFEAFGYDYPREVLYKRIETRVDLMIKAGLIDEVRGLFQRGIKANAQCMQGIGYKEIAQFLKNESLNSNMSDIKDETIKAMSDKIKQNTRNYAKRQLTFFKRMQHYHLIVPQNPERAAEEVIKQYDH